MKLFEIFRRWEFKYALTFVGTVIGVVGVALALYPLFQRTAPDLRMEVVSVANVVDVKEDVGRLEVLYEGMNLRSNRQTLTVTSLKVSNDGAAPIRISDYDPSFPVGVEITHGKIAKAEPSRPSSKYIETHLTNLQYSDSKALMPPLIMEPGESFWLKLLVLRDDKSPLEIEPIGKIAGIKEITFVPINANAPPAPSFWGLVFSGSTKVQVARAVIYSILCGSVMLGIVAFDKWQERRRSRAGRLILVTRFRASRQPGSVDPEFEWVLDLYVRQGEWILFETIRLIDEPPEARRLKGQLFGRIEIALSPSPSTMRRLLEQFGLFERNPEFAKLVRDFVAFLRSQGREITRQTTWYGGDEGVPIP
jgi:hypothetical protein